MPGLSFGLKSAASTNNASNTKRPTGFSFANSKTPSSTTNKTAFPTSNRPPSTRAKRKNLFDAHDDDANEREPLAEQDADIDESGILDSDPSHPRAAKSPKLSSTSSASSSQKYTSLSALRNARLHDAQASQVDQTVYDYDAVYDSFHSNQPKDTPSGNGSSASTGPKYMTSLLSSASLRKRDQLRATEKKLLRDREKRRRRICGDRNIRHGRV